jgi:ketosteroid isomerase-like protein
LSEENIATIRAIWAAFNRGDFDEAFSYAPDDFVADWSSSNAPEAGVYRGREEVKWRMAETAEAWSELEYFEDEIIDAGTHVVRVGGVRARGSGSGAEVVAHGAQVWTFDGDVPISIKLYQSKEDALKAVGYSE